MITQQRNRQLNRLRLDGTPKRSQGALMQNLGLVLLVFSLVCFVIACFNAAAPNWNKLIAAGLAFGVAAQIFGGVASRFLH